MGEWLAESETPEEKALRLLAEKYHHLCDTYDEHHCSGRSPRTGEALPATPDEMAAINAHALTVRNSIMAEGRSMGFSREQIARAISHYSKSRETRAFTSRPGYSSER